MLSTCDKKKADWYVKKGLAVVVNENPFTVQLNFEPAGKPQSKDDFQLNERSNCCVVCGYNGHVAHKNIIPRDYKKFFPEEYKSHNPHDVVPLCIPCHQQSNMIDHDFKRKISEEFNVPLDDGGKMMSETKEKLKIHRAANALKYNIDKIPHERKQQLVDSILNYYKENVLDQRLLDRACSIDKNELKAKQVFVSHAEQVVNILKKDNVAQNIYDFQKLWREHFLESMQPKHMPSNWSVDYKHLASTRSEVKKRKLKPRTMSARLKVAIEQVSSSDSARSQPLKSSLKKKPRSEDKEKKASKASFSVFNEMRAFLSRDFNLGSPEQPSLVNEPDRTSNSEEVLNTRLLLQDEDGVRKKNKNLTRSSSVDPLAVKKTKSDGNLVVKKLTSSGKKRGINVKKNLLEDLHCDPEPQIDAKNVCFKADSKAADFNQTDNIVQSEGVVQVDKEKGELLLTEKKGGLENENLSHVPSSFAGDLASCVEDDSVMLVLSPDESQDNLKSENADYADKAFDESICRHREDNEMRISSSSSDSSIPNADTFEIDQVVKSIDSENVLQATKQISEMKKEVSFRSNQRSIFSDSDENILSCEDQKSSRSDEFYSLAAFESTEDVAVSSTFDINENAPAKIETSSNQASSLENNSMR